MSDAAIPPAQMTTPAYIHAASSPPASYSEASTTTVAAPGPSSGGGAVQCAGLNIAGFDFGGSISGSCDLSAVLDPGETGTAQTGHFVHDDGLSVFRLPVSWQYVVAGELGGELDEGNFGAYDKLVQWCWGVEVAMCIVNVCITTFVPFYDLC